MSQNWIQQLRERPFLLLIPLGILGLMIVVMRNGWLSDDCYITFRTLYNFTHGHGLRWNITERVQTYTHPLWLFTLLPLYKISGHAWLTANVMGLGFTLFSAILLFKLAKTPQQGLLGLCLLIFSKAFIDFSTSGLENPLTHFLVLLFAIELFKDKKSTPNLFRLTFLAALLMLNRLDHLLLVAPVLAWVFWQQRSAKAIGQVVLGLLPLLMWEIFSLIYYGFPFPNTYYAKVLTDWPREILTHQGLTYLKESFQSDYVSMPLILLTGLGIALRGNAKTRFLGLGVLLYFAYIIWVGGDFMTGRFIATPFVIAVALFTQLKFELPFKTIVIAGILAISLFQPLNPLYTGREYYQDRSGHERELYPHGIVDEKGMAWWRSGALALHKDSDVFKVEREMDTWEPFPGRIVLVKKEVAVGFRGYQSGPAVHVVDQLALTDPVLARMPAERRELWRIGHFFRTVTTGYMETIESGQNQIEDPQLAQFYDRMTLVTQAPIFSKARFQEILRFNLGGNDALIDRERYVKPSE